jgi:hypothetical protein
VAAVAPAVLVAPEQAMVLMVVRVVRALRARLVMQALRVIQVLHPQLLVKLSPAVTAVQRAMVALVGRVALED